MHASMCICITFICTNIYIDKYTCMFECVFRVGSFKVVMDLKLRFLFKVVMDFETWNLNLDVCPDSLCK